MSLQNEIPPSGDEENAGYESSSDSEDLPASFEKTVEDEIDHHFPSKEPPLDIEDTNFIWVV